MEKKRVVVVGNMSPIGLDFVENQYEIIAPKTNNYFSKSEIIASIDRADALLSMFSGPRIDSEILDHACDRLKIIANFGVGYDNIDIEEATKRGIPVTNTPQPVLLPTSELAMGLIIDAARKISFCNKTLKEQQDSYKWGIWENMGTTLHGKKLGIIGMGRIGKDLAKKAQAFGMEVFYHNRTQLPKEAEEALSVQYYSLNELVATCDVISLNAPANPSTFHILSEKEFSKMKPTAIVVNTARGNLIKEAALIDALQSKRIAAAALDVYENGDGHPSQALFNLENVTIVPHIGTQTIDTRKEMAQYAFENIRRCFAGEPLLSAVNDITKK